MKNTLLAVKYRVDEAEDQIKDLEYKEAKNTQSQQQKEKRIKKNKDNVRSLWDYLRYTHIWIMGVPEEEREQEVENLF